MHSTLLVTLLPQLTMACADTGPSISIYSRRADAQCLTMQLQAKLHATLLPGSRTLKKLRMKWKMFNFRHPGRSSLPNDPGQLEPCQENLLSFNISNENIPCSFGEPTEDDSLMKIGN